MYVVTRECPIQCLAPFLSSLTYNALLDGVAGSPATVGQVVELYECGRLMDIHNIGAGRMGEIRRSLIEAKLIDPAGRLIISPRVQETSAPRHHVTCSHHLSRG